MTSKHEEARCRAIAASERVEADATTLANVRKARLRSAARWDEMADRAVRFLR